MLLLSFSHSLCTSFITGDDSTADGFLDLLGNEEGGIDDASPHVIVDGCRLKQEIEPLHMGISRSDFLAGKTSTSCFEESGPLAGKSTRGSQEIGSRFGPSGLRRNTTPHRSRHRSSPGWLRRPTEPQSGRSIQAPWITKRTLGGEVTVGCMSGPRTQGVARAGRKFRAPRP